MTNVLSIASYRFLPAKMGGQKNIGCFNEYFAQEVKLTCITVKDNDPKLAKGYELFNILSNSRTRYINLFLFFTIKRIIKTRQITHLVLEHPYYGWLGRMLKNATGVKLIIRSQNIEAERFRSIGKWWWKIMSNYEGSTHRAADQNFFIQADDMRYAIDHYRLDPAKCHVITYGFDLRSATLGEDRAAAAEEIRRKHGVKAEERILLFNGTLDYAPNLSALRVIVSTIEPELSRTGYKFKLLVCGKNLPDEFRNAFSTRDSNLVYCGFVDDINIYFKAADLLINPVIEGGGIKTKVVEAIGYGCPVISTESGAIGIPSAITGGNLVVVPDTDQTAFIRAIQAFNKTGETPSAFFDHFYWGNIAIKAASLLKDGSGIKNNS